MSQATSSATSKPKLDVTALGVERARNLGPFVGPVPYTPARVASELRAMGADGRANIDPAGASVAASIFDRAMNAKGSIDVGDDTLIRILRTSGIMPTPDRIEALKKGLADAEARTNKNAKRELPKVAAEAKEKGLRLDDKSLQVEAARRAIDTTLNRFHDKCTYSVCAKPDLLKRFYGGKLKSCETCFAKYCSRECQKADWPAHKLVCKASVAEEAEPAAAAPAAAPAPSAPAEVPVEKCFNPACDVDATAKKLSKCSRCHFAKYCSAACQKAHWPAHRVECVAPVSTGAGAGKA